MYSYNLSFDIWIIAVDPQTKKLNASNDNDNDRKVTPYSSIASHALQ